MKKSDESYKTIIWLSDSTVVNILYFRYNDSTNKITEMEDDYGCKRSTGSESDKNDTE